MKTALLVVSFGTTHLDTLEKTIAATENTLAAAFPEFPLYRAFTSGIVRKRLKAKFDIHADSVEEAMTRIAGDGFEQVIVQPTLLIPGEEYDKLCVAIEASAGNMKVCIGTPCCATNRIWMPSSVCCRKRILWTMTPSCCSWAMARSTLPTIFISVLRRRCANFPCGFAPSRVPPPLMMPLKSCLHSPREKFSLHPCSLLPVTMPKMTWQAMSRTVSAPCWKQRAIS